MKNFKKGKLNILYGTIFNEVFQWATMLEIKFNWKIS